MTLSELKTKLEATGLPVAYYAFPEQAAPPLPFVCYLITETNNFGADGGTYLIVNHINIELYTELKDPATEKLVENALSGIYWQKRENYIASENCWQIIYEIEV